MKKHRKDLLLILLLTLAFLPLQVLAHGGRTDSNGGHVDSDTGEYHYHHGFEAHDHYDMDGDGTPDCPYDFVDRTGHSSGDHIGTGSRTDPITETVPRQHDDDADKTSLWDVISVLLEYLPGAIAVWLFSSYFFSCILALFFDTRQGCSFSAFIGAVIALWFYIWSVISKFT